MTARKPSKVVEGAVTKPKPPSAGIGRKKGIPNKSTAAVKAALIEAFDKSGGVPALVKFAKSNPVDFYKLWAKLLPTEISGPDGGAIAIEQADALSALPKGKRDTIRAAIAAAMKG
jgi:hypothetical protein